MRIDEVNNILKGKRPVSAQPEAKPTANKPNTTTLRVRIAEARKAVGVVMAQAKNMKAFKIMLQARELNGKLVALEAELNRISP